jgi:hypothetical protein
MASRGPKAVGLCNSDIDGCAAIVNEITQRLLLDPLQPDEGWFGTWARMAFNVDHSNPYITTPRDFARITAMDVCKKPVLIRNEWYEFLDFGTGLRPAGCSGNALCENLMAFQRGGVGGTVVSAYDFKPPNKIIRIYMTNAADAGKHVLIQGKDQSGAPVTSTDGTSVFQGEFLTLASPFVEGSEELSELTGIQKDVTVGQVQIFQVDTNTQEQSLLTIMEATEEVASYSRIFLNGLPNGCCGTGCNSVAVEAMVKLDFVPVRVTTDYILIPCLPAYIEEAQCIRFEGMDSARAKQMAAQHHSKALSFLGGQMDHMIGKQRVSIGVPLWNQDRLCRQPV